ncbi:MAG: tetratricopeptide repeat protein [bacterium]|nr:tetratricopeptide repeat protein [bacterium]
MPGLSVGGTRLGRDEHAAVLEEYAVYLRETGRPDEALAILRQAESIGPSPFKGASIQCEIALILTTKGEVDEALRPDLPAIGRGPRASHNPW